VEVSGENNSVRRSRLGVITPLFNCEEYVEETINSVLDSIGNSGIEYIVVNDGSTDLSLDIVMKYQDRIKILNQANLGESAAVNLGFSKSSADYLLVVNADDPLISEHIFYGVEEYFDENSDLVAWYPDWIKIDKHGTPLEIIQAEDYSEESLVGRFRCLPGPGTFIRKSTALSIGGRSMRWKYVSDFDFWLRMSRYGRLERRPQVLAQWRFHEKSASQDGGLLMFSERSDAVKCLIDNFPVNSKIKRMALANYLYFGLLPEGRGKRVIDKFTLLRALIIGRGRITESSIKVMVYILIYPLSKYLKYACFRVLDLLL
jgi:glycosyltransferase involved in cell wall biosynthesis